MRTKKVYKQIGQSKIVGVGDDRPVVGFGYMIIPSDLDRSQYLRRFYRTGLAMIVTSFNEVVKNVKVPTHLLQEVQFPKISGEYGSLVSWSNVATSNQMIISGIYQSPGQMHVGKEGVWKTVRSVSGQGTISTTIDLNTKTKIVSSKNDEGVDGGLTFVSRSEVGSARFSLYNNGTSKLEVDDNFDLFAENKVEVRVGSENSSVLTILSDGTLEYVDQHGNSFKISEGEILQDAEIIKLGKDAEEPAMLGDQWESLQSRLIDAIKTLTVPTALGPSGVPINVAIFEQIAEELDQAKSSKVKVE